MTWREGDHVRLNQPIRPRDYTEIPAGEEGVIMACVTPTVFRVELDRSPDLFCELHRSALTNLSAQMREKAATK